MPQIIMNKRQRETYALEWMCATIPQVGTHNFQYEETISEIATSIINEKDGTLANFVVDHSQENAFDVLYCELIDSKRLSEAVDNLIDWFENGSVAIEDGVGDFFPADVEPEKQVA